MSDLSERLARLSPRQRAALERKLDIATPGTPEAGREPAIPRRPDGAGPAPLSPGQERLWFLQEFDPADPSYNLFIAQRMRGRLVVPALRHAIEEIVRRHDPLRARFPEVEGRPAQECDPDAGLDVGLIDLSGLPDGKREHRAVTLAAECRDTPFTLRTGPVVRAVLVRMADRDHVLCVAFHHIVSDGWSLKVFLSELGALYEAALDGRQARLPSLPVRYADYAAWDRARLQSEDLTGQIGYWTRRLEGARPLELPLDRPRPPVRTSAGGQVAVELPAALMERLEDLGRAHKATPFMTLMAAFQILLGRYSGQDDVCVGSVVAGRDRSELAPLIGFFPNTIVLRGDLSGDPRFGAFLDRVRGGVLDALAHQDARFEQVVAALDVERDPSRTPLFQAMFAMQDAAAGMLRLPGLDCELFDPGVRRAMFELTLDIVPRPGATLALLTYATDLYDRRTAERLLGSYRRLLEFVAENGDLPLSAIHRGLADAADRGVQGPPEATWDEGTTLTELVAAQARRDPGAIAVVQGGEGISRRELDARVDRLAAALRERGIGAGGLVAVGMRRTPDLIAALLAIHRAGAAYLPLDPRDPPARTGYMLRDSGASLLITDGSVGAGDVPTLGPGTGAEPGPWPSPAPHDLAYVLYTSGSTGRPKGVEVEHGALTSLLGAMREVLHAGPGDRWLAMTSLSFDISALELFLPLACGGTVVLAEDEQIGDGTALAALIGDAGITHVQATPSGWRMLLDGGFTGPAITALTGGEAIAPGLAGELRARTGRLVNVYGPTETTIWSTFWEVPERVGEVSIGGPIAGTTLRLLDARLDPVPPGAVGELCIGGAGVARGYRDRPGTTAERFVPDPSGPPGSRLYRTGDLARVRPDGLLGFLGRRDGQVKLRGHRVEPGEIEAVLLVHPRVGAVAVTVHEDGPGDQRLAAYVVPRPGGARPAAAELREHAARTLPAYMVPGTIVDLDELPLTPNGKLDRARLPRPGGRPAEQPHLPPETAAEELVAGIWCEVLGVDRVGALDDFFQLGGHSLLATKVTARLGATLELDVQVRTIFSHRSLRELATEVERLLAEEIDRLTDEEAQARLEG
jgi:amino acid adenylation domain-containing protein